MITRLALTMLVVLAAKVPPALAVGFAAGPAFVTEPTITDGCEILDSTLTPLATANGFRTAGSISVTAPPDTPCVLEWQIDRPLDLTAPENLPLHVRFDGTADVELGTLVDVVATAEFYGPNEAGLGEELLLFYGPGTAQPFSGSRDSGGPILNIAPGTVLRQRFFAHLLPDDGDITLHFPAGGVLTEAALVTSVATDIKPGTTANSVNPRANGVIPVAILTTSTFDATTVDDSTVGFGPDGAAAVHSAIADVDTDGDLDMVLHFRTRATGIACGDTSASLTGETTGGQAIEGTDSIVTTGCK
jgi:hypothetical protein